MKPGCIEILARGVCVMGGKLLLCHSKGATNTYLPGGHVEFVEKAKDALEREIMEELGLPSRAGRFLGAAEHSFVQKGEQHSEINLVFSLIVEGAALAAPPPSCEDYIEFQWQDLATLPNSSLEPYVLRELLPGWLNSADPEPWASTY